MCSKAYDTITCHALAIVAFAPFALLVSGARKARWLLGRVVQTILLIQPHGILHGQDMAILIGNIFKIFLLIQAPFLHSIDCEI